MVTVVSGGRSAFVVPHEATCLVEMRTPPGTAPTDALHEVRALHEPDWRADAELTAHRDGWRLDVTGPASDLSDRLGRELTTGTDLDAPYWMEALLWQRVCPTLICGPSGGGLHAVDEWVDLDQVRRFTRALTEVLGTRPGH